MAGKQGEAINQWLLLLYWRVTNPTSIHGQKCTCFVIIGTIIKILQSLSNYPDS